MHVIECTSRIEHVAVYARDAVVTRRVALPNDLPSAGFSLRVPGITPLALPGSFRAQPAGPRPLVGLTTAVVLPDEPPQPGEVAARRRDLQRRAERLRAERDEIAASRQRLLDTGVSSLATARKRRRSVRWLRDALSAEEVLNALATELDERLLELDHAIDDNDRELIAAQLEARQTPSQELVGGSQWTREALVSFAKGDKGPEELTLSYTVVAARWWPVYSARVSDGGQRAELAIEALIAQATLEDWDDVRVSVCTADLRRDLALPELRSLRLGRRQPPRRTGYRPPPQDTESLFVDYDRAMEQLPATAEMASPPPGGSAPLSSFAADKLAALEEEALADDDATSEMEMALDLAETRAGGPPPPEMAPGPPLAGSTVTLAAQSAPMPSAAPARTGGLPDGFAVQTMGPRKGGFLGGGGGSATPPQTFAAAADDGLQPGGDFRNFEQLQMRPVSGSRRGRLEVRQEPHMASQVGAARHAIERCSPLLNVRDPRDSRGLFDHRYDADGVARITADGRAQRIQLTTAEAGCTTTFRTVPREDESVYREISLENPFGAPLLDGPVDVFVDGALVITSDIGAVDRGGVVTFGLGVEERIQVARNATVNEESKGLLKGTTAVEHLITIELTSSLDFVARVDVLERRPVTADDDIEIQLVRADPSPDKYDQKERQRPVRGGLRFATELPPRGRRTISWTWTVRLPAKYELRGGNRRE